MHRGAGHSIEEEGERKKGQKRSMEISAILARLLMAIAIGGVLGAERGLRNRPAGLMTYVLVCMASAMAALTNEYLVVLYPQADPMRLTAQVVSGIGFLGAGTIIVTRNDEVRGLTTAAGLWMAAGLGLAAGAGFYPGAVIGFLCTVFALLILKRLDIYIKLHAKSMEIYLEYGKQFSLRQLTQFMMEHEFDLFDMQRGRVKTLGAELGTLVFSIALPKGTNHKAVLREMYTLDGVEYIKEIAG